MTIKVLSPESNRRKAIDKCAELATLIDRHTDGRGNGAHATGIAPLVFMRECDPGNVVRGVSEPLLAIVVQGQKEASLNNQTYLYNVAQYLLVSIDLPLSGCAVEATPDKPYLGFKLTLDRAQLCEIMGEIAAKTNSNTDQQALVRGWGITDAAPAFVDCAVRLTQLLDTPQDIPYLASVIIREIYYRLLTGEQGPAARQIATAGSHMQRIAEIIKQIKADFTQPLRIEDLAEQANMSASSLHRHFKKVTSMSPLQYQKQLRLLEARRLMLVESADAANAAYQVGYSSPSQFSREYSRLFGAPPIKDIESLRIA